MTGLVRDSDRKALAAAARSTRKPYDGAHDHVDQCSPSPPATPERRTPGCSEALTRRLAAHRMMALQAMPAQNSTVALACLVHVFVLRTVGADYPRKASALQVSPQMSAYALEAAADDLKAGRQVPFSPSGAAKAPLTHTPPCYNWPAVARGPSASSPPTSTARLNRPPNAPGSISMPMRRRCFPSRKAAAGTGWSTCTGCCPIRRTTACSTGWCSPAATLASLT